MSSNNSDKPQSVAGFDVSPEFIEESKKLNLVKPRQKFAPYTRAEREKRRKKVYRLHIELGMPAVRIADMMKVDRNTINADIRAIYNELVTPGSLADDHAIFTARLEGQRGRLMEYLNNEKDLQAKLMIERQITDIDSRLLSARQRIEENTATVFARATEIINKYMEEQKLDYRAITAQQFLRISPEGHRAMMNILRKEKVISNQDPTTPLGSWLLCLANRLERRIKNLPILQCVLADGRSMYGGY